MVGRLVGNAVFSETALGIFLIFYMNLGKYKGRKVIEPDFWKKSLIWIYSRKGLQISVGWLVGNAVLPETALRTFLMFCMKLGDYKGRKVTESDISWFRDIREIVPELGLVGWLVGNAVFSETTLRIFLIFCMKLGEKSQTRIFEKKDSWFGDIREKVSKLTQNQTVWYFSQKRL